MPQPMSYTSYSAEYYLEYKVERVSGDAATIKTPKIYFERDGKSKLLTYAMYTVPEEWVMQPDNNGTLRKPTQPLYNKVRVLFDISGADCAALTSNSPAIEVRNEITYEQFYRDGCRVMVENNGSRDHSGVGVIEMFNNGVSVAKFMFSVNFVLKRKIAYTLRKRKDGTGIVLEFTSKDRPVNIPVRVVYNIGRMPCLKNDMALNVLDQFDLDFSRGDSFTYSIALPQSFNRPNVMISASLCSDNLSRFYTLDCQHNDTLFVRKMINIGTSVAYTCPFCHKPIAGSLASSSQYQKGGVGCQAGSVSLKVTPTIQVKSGTKAKKYLYCSDDLRKEDAKFNPNFLRLLPHDFLGHDNFKIAMAGSKRAGKTTYISRFFDLSGPSPINMPMTTMSNYLRLFNIDVKVAPIPRIRPASGDLSYTIDDVEWPNDQRQYTERSINLDPPRFPGETTTGDYTSYPFIAEVNSRAYVSFYDIAGEDAEHTTQIRNIANNEPIGIFCIINGQADRAANEGVITMLQNARLNPKSPVAVIVTKMDMLESQFDASCQCLRTDYYDNSTSYEGSELQRNIDQSSEEIRSYLSQNNLVPNFGDATHGGLGNVKFFGVSAFNFLDSIHTMGENVNDPGKIRFECSSKRMELPFIWMMKQFGVIK